METRLVGDQPDHNMEKFERESPMSVFLNEPIIALDTLGSTQL